MPEQPKEQPRFQCRKCDAVFDMEPTTTPLGDDPYGAISGTKCPECGGMNFRLYIRANLSFS